MAMAIPIKMRIGRYSTSNESTAVFRNTAWEGEYFQRSRVYKVPDFQTFSNLSQGLLLLAHPNLAFSNDLLPGPGDL